MIAPDHNRRLEFSIFDQVVHSHSKLGTVAIAEPANSRRQTLKLNALPREFHPARQSFIFWKQLQGKPIGSSDIFGVAAQRHPTKGSTAFTKKRTNVLRNKPWNVERVCDAGLLGLRPDVVSVIESHRALLL